MAIMYKNRLLCIIANYVNEPWHIYIEDDQTDNSLSSYQKRCNGDNGKNCKNLVVEYLEVQLADG